MTRQMKIYDGKFAFKVILFLFISFIYLYLFF